MALPPAPKPAVPIFDNLNFLSVLNAHSNLFVSPSYEGILDVGGPGTTYNSLKEITLNYMSNIRSIGTIATNLSNLTNTVNGFSPSATYVKNNLTVLQNLVNSYGSIQKMLADWNNLPATIQAQLASMIGTYTSPLTNAISGAGGLNDRVKVLRSAFEQYGTIPAALSKRVSAMSPLFTACYNGIGRVISTANKNVSSDLFGTTHSIALYKVQGFPPTPQVRNVTGNGAIGYIGELFKNVDFWITQPDCAKAALSEVANYMQIVVGPAIQNYPVEIGTGMQTQLKTLYDGLMIQLNGMVTDVIAANNKAVARFNCVSSWNEATCRPYVG